MKKRKRFSKIWMLLICMLVLTVLTAGTVVSYAEDGAEISESEIISDGGDSAGYLEDVSVAEEHIDGLIPEEKEIFQVPEETNGAKLGLAAGAIPAAYRSDTESWAEGIGIKDQGRTALCWACSMVTAAEYSYAKESYEQTGAVSEMSPGHLAYFLYNRVNDPLGQTEGDRNNIGNWVLDGGTLLDGMQHWATWSGSALEEIAPFSRIADHVSIINNQYVWDGTIPYDDQIAYEDYLTLENSDYLGAYDVNAVKRMVLEYGAVSTGLQFTVRTYMNLDEEWITETGESKGKYIDGRSFYNFSDKPRLSHAVTIIGWDDSYPRTNFTHETGAGGAPLTIGDRTLTPEEAREITTPKSDGAWIVQNSWGPDVHENGICYVSYESHDLIQKSKFIAVDMQPAETWKYNFQYDGTSDCGDSSDTGNERFYTAQGTSAANIYKNITDHPISLGAVGFTTYNEGLSRYTIDVYAALKDPSNPTSGKRVGTTRAVTESPGAKSAELDEEVYIPAGETFSIVFTFGTENHFGVEKGRNANYVVEVNPQQSFFREASSGNWQDIYSYGACYRIKGLANETPYQPDKELELYTDGTFTGLKRASDGSWWYLEKGKVNHSFTSIVNNEYGWWYVNNGMVDFSYTGVKNNEYGWWKIENGKVNFNFNGFASNEYGWWFLEGGKVLFNRKDIIYGPANTDPDSAVAMAWWYVKNSKVTDTETIAQNVYGWWYVRNGRVDFSYTGVKNNEYGWWKIENGKVNFSFTGLASNEYGTWYIKNGKVDFCYNGTYQGKKIINGKVQ